MKCVCPMGGDRTCPDNCLLGAWHGLPDDQKTKVRRLPIVEALAKQGYTQEAIALQLGVSQSQIQRDLGNLPVAGKLKPAKTATNPKGAGRPKGSGRGGSKRESKRGQAAKTERAREIIRDKVMANEPLNSNKLAEEHGISHVTFDMATAAEMARKEALEEKAALDPTLLSKTAQEKLDIAIRAHKRKLDQEFEPRVQAEVARRIDEIVLPHWREQIDQAKKIYERRKGVMDKATFNQIRRGLHPDSRNSISDKMLATAFDAFMALEKYLLNEQDSPTQIGDLPDNLAAWDRMRAKPTKRGNSTVVRSR